MIGIRTQARITGEERYRLGPDLQVDPARNGIVRDGQMQTVEPRVMELLVYLSSRPGQLVTKRQLMDEVWRTNVVDEAIQRAVSLLRSALGDTAQESRIIETMPRQGYRLLVHPSPIHPPGGQARWAWLAAGAAALALTAIAIAAMLRPGYSAPTAQPPVQTAHRVEVREPGRSEVAPAKRPPPRQRAPSPAARSSPPPALDRNATPTPEAVLAPPAPAAQPRASAEAPSPPEATPAPAPSPDAAR